MKKRITMALMLILSLPSFAGGLLTNTNQHVSFLRMIARGASIDVDGVYSNPAGLGFMDDGFYLALNVQSAYQTRTIDATYPLFGNMTKEYEGKASAPVIPSFQAVYKMGNWAFSGSFAITGGGGKASFNDGLAMFDSQVMAGLHQAAGITPDKYTINSAMDGKQYIYGFQLGASYKINDYLSVFGGGRMNYVTGGYEGYLHAVSNASPSLSFYDIELDCEQTGWGITPIIGADVKYGNWNLGLKYEFMANLNVENKTKTNTSTSGELADYKDGVNTPHDIPALLTAAVGYEILPTLRASVEYHMFFDKDAGMANDKQKYLTGNTNEYLAGIEWDVHPIVSLSAGYQKTDYGLADNFQSDISFSLDSYSIGLGGVVKITPNLNLNVAYFWTSYDDYKKTSQLYTANYGRTNKVFGVGVDYKF
ncbi:hypothetical protein LJB91_03655 [Bacteroidales bacterium OttesenSCG-928-L03]|nr:hypothetical protein [Bacteroidales bacterium OttesenSCG-928-L03]